MNRIAIPFHYLHTRSTPFWTGETTPTAIWTRIRARVFTRIFSNESRDPLRQFCR